MPVDARRLIRKMRGGAQAHLIEAGDGHCYVVKFVNNPQHRRILVNDWFGTAFLRYLGLSAPEPALVRLTPEFIAENRDLHIQLGPRQFPPEPGWHFGSRFPGDPLRTVVYDYLPDVLLQGVANRKEFAGVLAFDQWTGNADSRQAIFFRAQLMEFTAGVGGGGMERSGGAPSSASASQKRAASSPIMFPKKAAGSAGESQKKAASSASAFQKKAASSASAFQMGAATPRAQFVAQMIDHGFLFDGPHWRFGDSPIRGLYHRPLIYGGVQRIADFEPWLDRIVHFPEEVIDQTVKQIPPQWIAGDEDALDNLMEQLLRRRKRVPGLIEACRRGRAGVFPDWNES